MLPRPPGSSEDGIVGLGANLTSVSSPGPPMAPFYGLPPGTDIRGLGLETFVGRGAVRNSTGTTRPPTIPPELWQLKSPELKAEAVEVYLAQLAADAAAFAGVAAPGVTAELSVSTKATVGNSALADSTDWQSKLIHDDDLPRLPREFETLRKPHRERSGTWHPQVASRASCRTGKWTLAPRLAKLWTRNGRNFAPSNAPILSREKAPGTKETSEKHHL